MADIKDLLKDKQYPSFVKDHPVFKEIEKVDKIFPHIGLPNASEEISIDNSAEITASASHLIDVISAQLTKRKLKLEDFAKKKESPEKKQMRAERKAKYAKCDILLKELQEVLKDKSKVISTNGAGKTSLNIPANIMFEEKQVFKNGEGLFGAYNKLSKMLEEGKFNALKSLDTLPAFKDFSSKNIPAKKQKIVFSSDGAEGLWDIATMSMRGIQSCQSWSSGNSSHIVGSMIDPFTGIIYITSGGDYDNLGPKMIRRCVVRFIVNEKTKQPVLYLERMYPAYEKATSDLFISYLAKKTENKFPIIDGNVKNASGHYVPMSGTIKTLAPQNQPYRDSQMPYKTDANDVYGAIKEQSAAIFEKLHQVTGIKTIAAIRNAKMNEITNKDAKEVVKMIRGTSSVNDISYLVYSDIVDQTKKLLNKTDIKQFASASKYIEKTINDFTKALDKHIYNSLTSSVKTHLKCMPTYTKVVLPEKPLRTISNSAAEQVSQFAKEELAKLTQSEKKQPSIDELPIYVKLLN